MKKNLYICETPFQVLAALLLIFSHNANQINDIVLTDNMKNGEVILEKLENSRFVRYAYFANVNHGGKQREMEYFLDAILPFHIRWSFKYCDSIYDRIYLRNFTACFAISCVNFFKRKNSKLETIIFDEGYSNYTEEFWRSEKRISKANCFITNIMRIFGRKPIYKYITKALFFQPELLHINLCFETERMIPENFTLSLEQQNEINRIFSYEFPKINLERKKIIFFEECFAFDQNNNNDLILLDKIAKIAGKENIIIKRHPRSEHDRFTELGYNILANITYPWEIFALNNAKNNNLIFIAYSSGALLNYLFFTKSKLKSIMLYKAFPKLYKHTNQKSVMNWLNEFCKLHSDIIELPESEEELLCILNEELK